MAPALTICYFQGFRFTPYIRFPPPNCLLRFRVQRVDVVARPLRRSFSAGLR